MIKSIGYVVLIKEKQNSKEKWNFILKRYEW